MFYIQEKKYSSPMIFVDMFIQTLQIEIVVCIVSFIFLQFNIKMLVSFGLWNLWMIHICRFCFEDPEGAMRIPCLPCTIQKKYYPGVICLVFVLLFGEGLSFLIAAVVGHIQSIYFKGYLLPVRLSWLKLFETFTPKMIKERQDYYSLQKCPDVMYVCRLGFG
jgi:hypothetical protein